MNVFTIISLLILFIIGISWVIDWRTVTDPHFALKYRFGAILNTRLLPGIHHFYMWGGIAPITAPIYLPGNLINIDVRSDKALTKDKVPVLIDVSLYLRILRPYDIYANYYQRELSHNEYTREDMYPAFGPAKEFATWLLAKAGISQMGYIDGEGNYRSGALDLAISDLTMNAVTQILMKHESTDSEDTIIEDLREMIVAVINQAIGRWGMIESRWENGTRYITGFTINEFDIPDAVQRSKQLYDAKTAADIYALRVRQSTDELKRYQEEFGEEYAQQAHTANQLAKLTGMTFNVFSTDGIKSIFSALFSERARRDKE